MTGDTTLLGVWQQLSEMSGDSVNAEEVNKLSQIWMGMSVKLKSVGCRFPSRLSQWVAMLTVCTWVVCDCAQIWVYRRKMSFRNMFLYLVSGQWFLFAWVPPWELLVCVFVPVRVCVSTCVGKWVSYCCSDEEKQCFNWRLIPITELTEFITVKRREPGGRPGPDGS